MNVCGLRVAASQRATPAPSTGGGQGWQVQGGAAAEAAASGEWEQGGGKAAKKKKANAKVDPNLLGFAVSSTSRNSGGLDFGEV